jgi:hypothetical protein
VDVDGRAPEYLAQHWRKGSIGFGRLTAKTVVIMRSGLADPFKIHGP